MSTKIYTKTGDKGKTSLFDGTRVGKDNIRLETYGTFDELSSLLGVVQSFSKDKKLNGELQAIQKDLLDIGAQLANPHQNPAKKFLSYLDIRVVSFEKTIDTLTSKLKPLTNFILFTGNKESSFLQLSRSVARRCERRLTALSKETPVPVEFIRYFNRLSDLLYTMGRFANSAKGGSRKNTKEVIWKPFT
ncbi:MAG TPA: cob(I)yrinic acid a,c-diamide adenosyltransferase [Patescibacteria group bacterium]|nr:cob(I)yrinic acid a,c-diamide adenosyltransferase [Patescibacteria group bacterium]